MEPPSQPDVRESDQQCRMRDANEATERRNAALPEGGHPVPLRCECGDPSCAARLSPTHAEYEEVRASGSHFIIDVDHENPETACVVRQNDRHAVVDVVAGEARYAVLARNPRHVWVAPAAPGREGNTP